MRELYEKLKARGISQDTNTMVKYWGKWNDHLKRIQEGKNHGINYTAVFFEFGTPIEWKSIGGGVQVADVMVRIHTLSKWMADVETGTSINLQIYDEAKIVHGWFQAYEYRGTDYGFSPMDRMNWHEDEDHDIIYHHISDYMTTWVDNSTQEPRGGYEINPILDAAITGEILEPETPSIVVSKTSIDFGNIAIGASATQTFTISGENIEDTEPLIISTTEAEFLITFATSYKTRLAMSSTDGVIAETTITVKFSPLSGGGFTGSILYGVPGLNGEITLTGAAVSYLLLETGDNLLLESGDSLLL